MEISTILLLTNLNFEYILMIEDSCLIQFYNLQKYKQLHFCLLLYILVVPVIKSILSSLSKSQTITDRFEVIQIIFELLNSFLIEESMHLFTCKDYGDISLFEIIQKVNNESVFIQSKDDQEQNQLSEVLKELQEFFNKLVGILEKNKYIDVKFEETESQQIQDPAYLYPMIMKPLVLRTSEVIKQPGWRKQLEEAYSHLSSTPPNRKMNRIIKELSGKQYGNSGWRKEQQRLLQLANIRYAMIKQLQKPPVGFEEAIQKSFYLRKDAIYNKFKFIIHYNIKYIIKEVQQWIDEADFPVNYHCTQNHNIFAPFQQQPSKFKSILTAEFEALKKELEN